jgi:hypothetical protein
MCKNGAEFIGVYAEKRRKAEDEVEMPHDCSIWREFKALCMYYYELEQCLGFEDLIDRVVIPEAYEQTYYPRCELRLTPCPQKAGKDHRYDIPSP